MRGMRDGEPGREGEEEERRTGVMFRHLVYPLELQMLGLGERKRRREWRIDQGRCLGGPVTSV